MMKLHHATADIFVPDGKPLTEALARITHVGIGAHQDDLEFMAFHGILACFHDLNSKFAGMICTNGSGSARTGAYADYSDEQMMSIRKQEQRTAAIIGRYGVMAQLDYPSKTLKDPNDRQVCTVLKKLLSAMQLRVVYTHNLADKHDTHVAVAVNVIHAIRELPAAKRPQQLIGCEVWRDLDWLPDAEKVVMDVSRHENLAASLSGVFDSQIAGGKRYDLATQGRRRANATFFESHATDKATEICFGMDLTPLVKDANLDVMEFTLGAMDRFKADVKQRLARQLGR